MRTIDIPEKIQKAVKRVDALMRIIKAVSTIDEAIFNSMSDVHATKWEMKNKLTEDGHQVVETFHYSDPAKGLVLGFMMPTVAYKLPDENEKYFTGRAYFHDVQIKGGLLKLDGFYVHDDASRLGLVSMTGAGHIADRGTWEDLVVPLHEDSFSGTLERVH
ncbi:MAG: hypothetical protein AAGF33_14605 [Pseudomonadota bacterium]